MFLMQIKLSIYAQIFGINYLTKKQFKYNMIPKVDFT